MPTTKATKARKATKTPAKPGKRSTSQDKPAQQPTKPEPTAAKTTKATEPKGPGVISSIVEFLSATTEAKPITRKGLVAKLVERFPEREETALARTVGCQIARLPKERGLVIKRTADKALYVAK